LPKFSVAGKGLGEQDTRGTLFHEIIRIAEVKQPSYMLLENVKGLTFKPHKKTFEKILSELDRIGYTIFWKVLNSKDYGIPQNRERVFFVCFRKGMDTGKFSFPQKEELKIFIKDILEEEVDKKYFLSPLLQERFRKYLEEKESKIVAMRGRNPENPSDRTIGSPTQQRLEFKSDGCSNALTSVQKDNLVYDRKGFDSRTKGFRESDLSPTLSKKMGTGGNNVPMILDYVNKTGEHQSGQVIDKNCVSPTLSAVDWKSPLKIVSNAITTAVGRVGHSKEELGYIENNMKCGQLRRLTPKECFRLMGFLDDGINIENLSDTQRYKLAGNGWDINIVSRLFKAMFNSSPPVRTSDKKPDTKVEFNTDLKEVQK